MATLMACGHTALGEKVLPDGSREVVCPICMETRVAESKPDLSGREAKCPDCNRTRPSDFNLPFFWYQPDKVYDLFYCGCRGWD